MLGSPQSASSYYDALYQQHSQSSCHQTTKEQTNVNCSCTAESMNVYRAAAVSFNFNLW